MNLRGGSDMTIRGLVLLSIRIVVSATFAVAPRSMATTSEQSAREAPSPATTAASNVGERLTVAMRNVLPDLSDRIREELVQTYLDSSPSGRAIAVHPPAGFAS
jgi:hypothetical protein